MRTLLIFCYILWSASFVSCGEKATKTDNNQRAETVNNQTEKTIESHRKAILFFGTSLTAGLGLELEEAYPALIQNKIDSLGLAYQTINAGLSGETTASGKNRIDWVLNQDVDIFVLELGANDGLRGVPLEQTKENLQDIIDVVKEKNSDTKIVLAGMQIPPNMGQDYTSAFKELFPQLAKENDITLIPFLLENVGGVAGLNQQDGIHPTAEGQKIMAHNVWEVIKPLLVE